MTRANAADWKAQPAGAEDACRVGEASAKYKAAASGYLPFGLKQTEVGIIPNDWEVKSMGAIGSLSKGRGLLKEDIRPNGSVPAVPYTALYTDFSEVLDYKRIKWFVDETEGTVVVDEPCVLIASSSNMAENTGKASAPPGHMPIAVGREVIIFRSGDSATFISYLLSTASYRKRTLALARGTTIKHLYPATFADYKLGLPALREQRVIAEALSDVDGLLEDLDALIAKKRAIRQAAMQQLLTGKTRLPGFSGEWKTKRLGDHVTFLRSGTNSRADLIVEGRIKYLHYGDIHTSPHIQLNPSIDQMPCLPAERAASLDRLRDGDLVFADASEDIEGVGRSVEILGATGHEVVPGLHTIAARFDKSVLVDGYKAFLQFCPAFRSHLRRLAAGTKVYATNRAHIASAEIPLPSPPEQQGIARVLHEMDGEIAALELRHEKTRAIKQGMMQQLLTGRIRLVPSSTAGPPT